MKNIANTNKILIVTSWAPPMIGGPQNLYNLFSLMDYRNYCVLTGYKTIINDGNKEGNWLKGKYFFFDHPDMLSKHKTKGNVYTKSSNNKIVNLAYKIYEYSLIIPGFRSLLYFFLFIFKTTAFIKKGLKTVREEKVQIIIGMSDNGPSMIASYWISRITRKRLIYYLFDIYKGNNFQLVDKLMSDFWEGIIFKYAKYLIVTNEGTKDFYRERYHNRLNIQVIHNSIDGSKYSGVDKEYRPTPPYRIIYTGHVYWAQEQALINVIEAVKKINNLPIILELYIPKGNKNISRCISGRKNIFLTQAAQKDMPIVQKRATLLVLPLSWNTKSVNIIKTATPGKYTDYLKSGRPMLVHAPKYAYISQYVKNNKLGIVVDHNDQNALVKTIRDFIADPKHGDEFVSNALDEFSRNHNPKNNIKKLEHLLQLINT